MVKKIGLMSPQARRFFGRYSWRLFDVSRRRAIVLGTFSAPQFFPAIHIIWSEKSFEPNANERLI